MAAILESNVERTGFWNGDLVKVLENLRDVVNELQSKIGTVLNATATFDPGSLVDGAGETSSAITVTGAAFGDFVLVAAPYDLVGITVTGYVSAANTVKIRVQNESGSTVDLASGSWKVKVIPSAALAALTNSTAITLNKG